MHILKSRQIRISFSGMRTQPIIGGLLVITGVFLLYLLRDLLFKMIVVVVGVIGIVVAFALIVGGLGLIFWRRRVWYRVEPETTT